MNNCDKKFKLQEDEYDFPYHHIPVLSKEGFSPARYMNWGCYGLEYISYLNHVIDLISNYPNESILDVGCGDGRLLNELYNRFPKVKLVGIDISERAINLAKALVPDVRFIKADITTYKNKEVYDIVTCIETLEHLPEGKLEYFLESLKYFANAKTRFVLTVPSTNIPLQDKHFQHFSKNTLLNLLKNNYIVEDLGFINKISILEGFFRRIMGNPIFILHNRYIINLIYRYYVKFLLHATENNAKRIYAILRVK